VLREGLVRKHLTVLVPTRDEADTIVPLIARLDRALVGQQWELLVVDDSDDATPRKVRAAAAARAHGEAPIRLLRRAPERRDSGLGGALADGLAAAGGNWVCVLHADLQHPPEALPRLLRQAERGELDLLVASRFAGGGPLPGLSHGERAVTRLLVSAARRLFPRQLRGLSDPLSGMFLLRNGVVDPDALHGDGPATLLEVLVCCQGLHVGEAGYRFNGRGSGPRTPRRRAGTVRLGHILRLRLRTWWARPRPTVACTVCADHGHEHALLLPHPDVGALA
jgi:dolichol-phosphate mannosyltransferase